MEVRVVSEKDGKRLNRWGEEVIACKTGCGRDTAMLGTKLCDSCWEDSRRKKDHKFLVRGLQ